MNDLESPNESTNPEREALHRIEVLISRLLFWGALVSILVAMTGLLIFIAKGGLSSGTLNLQDQLRQQSAKNAHVFVSIAAVITSLAHFSNPLAITTLGLLFLLLIPVITVALLIPAFFGAKDYRYSIVAAIVLVILIVSFIVGGV